LLVLIDIHVTSVVIHIYKYTLSKSKVFKSLLRGYCNSMRRVQHSHCFLSSTTDYANNTFRPSVPPPVHPSDTTNNQPTKPLHTPQRLSLPPCSRHIITQPKVNPTIKRRQGRPSQSTSTTAGFDKNRFVLLANSVVDQQQMNSGRSSQEFLSGNVVSFRRDECETWGGCD